MDDAEHFDEIHDPKMWLTAAALSISFIFKESMVPQSLSDCVLAVA